MRRRSVLLRFIPHVHKRPVCPVCDEGESAATEKPVSATSYQVPVEAPRPPPPAPPSAQPQAVKPVLSALTGQPLPTWVSDPAGKAVTTAGKRAAALEAFLKGTHEKQPQPDAKRTSASAGSSSLVFTEADKALWRRYMDDKEFFPSAAEADSLAKIMMDAALLEGYDGGELMSEEVSTTATPSSPEALKQGKFARTLQDAAAMIGQVFGKFAPSAQMPMFLCCGTALGATREGKFIAHDNDIDVGIFFEDFVTLGGGVPDGVKSGSEDELLAIEGASQEALMRLLEAVGTTGTFMCIDVIGSPALGLEVRLQHLKTGVLFDINIYYSGEPQLSAEGNYVSRLNAAQEGGDEYVWCATHYEESAKRKFGMYRYRHTHFRNDLVPVEFAGSTYCVPPTRYLVEYFGEDWGTPRQYSYTDGLGGEYRNIIDE